MDISQILKNDQLLIESYLGQYIDNMKPYGILRDAMEYSLLSGGKRIRPVLVLEFCRLFGGDVQKALPFACGLELMHTSSLIHDDLPCMDDDDYRRGRLTNHKVYGEANAVLAGDGLLIASFELLASSDLPADRVRSAVTCLSQAAGPEGMVAGQVLDLMGEGKQLSYDEIVEIESLKTGCMIEAAAKLGCIAAGSTAEQEEDAAKYARGIGLAFQIQDDILDVVGDAELLGKPIGSDEENNKSTFVALKGIDACKELVRELTDSAVSSIRHYSGSDFLCSFANRLADRNK